MRAELDGLICSGPRAGKAFTYALLEERVPRSQALTRDEALTELARRYFTSRGPATLQDFVWWSGLTTADARTGIEMAGSDLSRHVIDGRVCWLRHLRVPCGGRPERRTSCRCTTKPGCLQGSQRRRRFALLQTRHEPALRSDDCGQWEGGWDVESHAVRKHGTRDLQPVRAIQHRCTASRRSGRPPIRRVPRAAGRR